MNQKPIFSKDFILVAIGQIISLFGNQILRYALPLYLLNVTGSSALFGTVLAASFVPTLLLFPVGGIIADRLNKRNIMVVLDFSTAFLILLFCLFLGKADVVPLMAVTMILLYGIQGAYQPAVKASVPALVAPEHMMKANSVVDLISSLASMIGPVIGGILFSFAGLRPILWLAIGCFFLSAGMELFIRIPFQKQESKGNLFVTGVSDLKESFHFLFQVKPVLWKVSAVLAAVNLLLTPLLIIGLPVLITGHLGFSPDRANRLCGYAQGAMAAGAVIGGILAGVFSKKLKPKTTPLFLSGCAISMMAGGVALQWFQGAMNIYLVLVLGGSMLLILSTLFVIQLMTYLQILTPGELIGKVISCVLCVCTCTAPLGQLVYGLVFERIGNYAFLPFYGAALAMIAVSLFTRPVFYEMELMLSRQQ